MKLTPFFLVLTLSAANVPTAFHHATSAGVTADATVNDWWTALSDPELVSLIDRAAKANLDLKIASSRVLEARAARRITRADLLPSIESRNSIERVRGGLTNGLFNADRNSGILTPFETGVFQFGFDASWELDLFGGRRRALEASTAEVRGIEDARRDVLISVLAEVARNYAELRGY